MSNETSLALNDLTPQEREFMAMVKRGVIENRRACLSGEGNFRGIWKDGGLVDKYDEVTVRHRGGRNSK